MITEVEIPRSLPSNMDDVVSTTVSGMTCMSCVGRVEEALNSLNGAYNINVKLESGDVSFQGVSLEKAEQAIVSLGYSIGVPGESISVKNDFNWRDGSVWKQSAHNTKWCLVGCSIGDFGTIAAFQFIPYLDALGWSTMSIMLLAMFNGIMTSIALETIILSAQMALKEAFRVAIGMSLISMISMEAAMNIVDVVLTGGAKLTLWVIIPMLVAGFLTPWPYNYWRLKKYGMACH